MVFAFLISFRSIYHARSFIPRENHLNINLVYYGVDPNDNKDSLTLTYASEITI